MTGPSASPARNRQVFLLYNPASGSGKAVPRMQEVRSGLEAAGFAVEPRASEYAGHVTELAREAAEAGCEVVFTLGGDGTLREAATGLLGSQTAVAPIPFGTANVVAGAFGVPKDPKAACELYANALPRTFDVGLCGDETFVMQASVGLDGRVLRAVSPKWKSRVGRVAVGLAGLTEWWRYDYPVFEVDVDGRRQAVSFVAVCNLPQYGGQMSLIPAARPDDRRLDYLLLQSHTRRQTMSFALDFLRGRHIARDDVEVGCADRIVVRCGEEVVAQVDGDPLPERSERVIRLADSTIRLLVPRRSA